MTDQGIGVGEEFVRLTSSDFPTETDHQRGIHPPEAFKALPGEILPLPAVDTIHKPDMPLSQAIEQRRSLRTYAKRQLSQEELSFLLWATQWIKDIRSNDKAKRVLRNVPSAGARHPFETYLLINNVEGIKPGIYYYHPAKHGLILYKEGAELAQDVYLSAFEQDMVTTAPVSFIWVAIPYRTTWSYGQRGYRYLYLDAGHVGQNLHLAAEAVGCGAVMIAAFSDEMMNNVLSLNGKDAFVIYMSALGKKKQDGSLTF